MTRWYEEEPYLGSRLQLRVDKLLHEDRTEHQHLIVFENEAFGRVLALDGIVQTTERDEFIYHEMFVHVPVLAHGAVRRVLIIGGGDGGSLEETLKHRSIERVTMVELDPDVIALSRRFLPSIGGDAFDDPRTDLVIGDGLAYVAEGSGGFDLIIVDSTDPVGPGRVLFTEAFYRDCKACLKPGGVLVTQNSIPFLQPEVIGAPLAALGRQFADTTCYLAAVPSYFGGDMAFGWASDDPALRRVTVDELGRRFQAAEIATAYYTPEVHLAAFALPPHIATALGRDTE